MLPPRFCIPLILVLLSGCNRVEETNQGAAVGQPAGNVAVVPAPSVPAPPPPRVPPQPASTTPQGSSPPKVVPVNKPDEKSPQTWADIERYALRQRSVFQKVTGVASNDTLTMRARASGSADVVFLIPANAMYIKQIGTSVRNSETTWVPVEYADKQGFVNGAYLTFLDQASQNSPFISLQRALKEWSDLNKAATPAGAAFLRGFQKAVAEGSPLLQTADWPEKLAQRAVRGQ